MNNNYEIVSLKSNNPMIDFYGVRFNERKRSFMFWQEKNRAIKQVMVVFDNNRGNLRDYPDGTMILSLSGLSNGRDLLDAVRVFISILRQNNINAKISFVVSNDRERQVADAIGRELGVQTEIRMVGSNSNVKKVDQELREVKNNKDVNIYGSKTIETNNDDITRKITVNDDKAYVNTGILSIDEEKYLLLQEWKNDPYKSRMLMDKTPEEIDRMLLEVVTLNKKQYAMTSSSEQTALDKASDVAIKKASLEDGRVNSELGIVENGVSNSNQYSAVERDGNNIKVVNTSVNTTNINSGGVSNDSSSVSLDDGYNEASMKEEEEDSREVLNTYYVDESNNIYDGDGTVIGRIGTGYNINYDNNTIVSNGKAIANIGDYRDLGRDKIQNKPKVRTLKKDDDKGFATLPVIMFIISALLLVSSIILLFVLK